MTADLLLEDAGVSRRHAQIVLDDGGYFIEDLRSQNGTYVNGAPVARRRRLADGDECQIGGVVFTFHEPEAGGGQESAAAEVTQLKVEAGAVLPVAGEAASEREKVLERYLSVLSEVSRAVGTMLDVDDLVREVLDRMFDAFAQADAGAIFVRGEGGRLTPKAARSRTGSAADEVRPSRTLFRTAVEERQSVLSLDVRRDPRFDGSQSLHGGAVRSVMCVPLVFRNEVVGLVQLESHRVGEPFQDEDLLLLNAIGTEAAAAIQGALLHQDMLQARLLRHDLEIAHAVQKHFLPTEAPTVPGFRFVSHYEPAQQVGGDFYDFIPCPDGRWGVVVGDVSGKGVTAGLVMAKLTSELRFAALADGEPSAVLARVNATVCRKTLGMIFATVIFLKLDPSSGVCTVANAGHVPAFFRDRRGEVREVCGASGMPLGIAAEERYEQSDVTLLPGEFLLMVTDGVTEARAPSGEEFGFERVRRVLGSSGPAGEAVVASLRGAVAGHVRGATRKDDIALVGLERTDR
jgi:serine phosphatase RsbU (regulator of sigma subunit)